MLIAQIGGPCLPPVRVRMKDVVELEKKMCVHTEHDSPWSVEIASTCLWLGSNPSVATDPVVRFSVFFSGRLASVLTSVSSGLLSDGWEKIVGDAVGSCVTWLTERGVDVPIVFPAELTEAASRARLCAIRFLVRAQASRLIRFVPSSEACFIWSETEALSVMES